MTTGGCPAVELSIDAASVPLDKAVTVDSFVVGSTAEIGLAEQKFEVGPLEQGETAVIEIYAYTTIAFTYVALSMQYALESDIVLRRPRL